VRNAENLEAVQLPNNNAHGHIQNLSATTENELESRLKYDNMICQVWKCVLHHFIISLKTKLPPQPWQTRYKVSKIVKTLKWNMKLGIMYISRIY
jgi:hypothetical protein